MFPCIVGVSPPSHFSCFFVGFSNKRRGNVVANVHYESINSGWDGVVFGGVGMNASGAAAAAPFAFGGAAGQIDNNALLGLLVHLRGAQVSPSLQADSRLDCPLCYVKAAA